MLKVIVARFLLGKEITDMENGKTRMNPMVLGWHWRYYDELMVFSIHR